MVKVSVVAEAWRSAAVNSDSSILVLNQLQQASRIKEHHALFVVEDFILDFHQMRQPYLVTQHFCCSLADQILVV